MDTTGIMEMLPVETTNAVARVQDAAVRACSLLISEQLSGTRFREIMQAGRPCPVKLAFLQLQKNVVALARLIAEDGGWEWERSTPESRDQFVALAAQFVTQIPIGTLTAYPAPRYERDLFPEPPDPAGDCVCRLGGNDHDGDRQESRH